MRLVFGLVLILGISLAGFAVYTVSQYFDASASALERERQRSSAVIQTVEIYAPSRNLTYGELLRPGSIHLPCLVCVMLDGQGGRPQAHPFFRQYQEI